MVWCPVSLSSSASLEHFGLLKVVFVEETCLALQLPPTFFFLGASSVYRAIPLQRNSEFSVIGEHICYEKTCALLAVFEPLWSDLVEPNNRVDVASAMS
jgi:hypothetical protein